MATGHLVLLFVAAALLVARIVFAIVRRDAGPDEPTYPEPTLALDQENEAPHDVFGELASTLDADQAAEGRYLAAKDQAAEHVSANVPVARKIVASAGLIAVLVAVPYAHPSLGWFRLFDDPSEPALEPAPIAAVDPLGEEVVGEWKLQEATDDQEGRARDLEAKTRESRGPIAQARETMPAAVDEDAPPRSLEDPSGKALDAFFAKLVALERKETDARAHILYYGDSVIASDFITGKLRRMLQTRFGDAGHGYAIVANAWPGWFHYDVSRKASAEWKKSTCVGPYAEDGFYGLGCASFSAEKAGVWAEMGTNPIESYAWNQAVTRFEVEYLKQPGGGAIDLFVDGERQGRLETDAPEAAVAWHAVEVPEGPHTLRIETVDERPVRTFGIRMDRDVAGVTLSALGVTGARARFLDKQDDAHWRQVLEHTSADLVVLSFGGNEVQDGNKYPMDQYRETLEAVMVQVEEALPGASYMLVSPTDMASAKASQGHSLPMVYYIVEEQKKLAAKRGWAFWDQFRAMGGGGTMWAWIKQGLGNPDMFHPTGEGGGLLGKWEYLALMQAFEKYKADRR